jgi:hypothetical protein
MREKTGKMTIYKLKTPVSEAEIRRISSQKEIRETAKLKEGSYVTIKTTGNTIIIEPTESVIDKYYGAFKIDKWPEDIDELTVESAKASKHPAQA